MWPFLIFSFYIHVLDSAMRLVTSFCHAGQWIYSGTSGCDYNIDLVSTSLLSDSDLYRLGDYPSRSVNLINYFLFLAIFLLKSSNSSIKQIIGLYNLDGFPQNWFIASHAESAPVVEVVNICIQPFAVISLLLLYFCRSLIVLQDGFYCWSLPLISTADLYCWFLLLISTELR